MNADLSAAIQYLFGVGYYLTYFLEVMILIIVVYFIGKRKLMIEIKPTLDFQESVFPNIKQNYFDQINKILHIKPPETKTDEPEEAKPGKEEVEPATESPGEKGKNHLKQMLPRVSRANVAIHDAPLWLLSYSTLVIVVLIYNVMRFFLSKNVAVGEETQLINKLINFDRYARYIQNTLEKFVGMALPSLNGYLLSLLFYTFILTILLILLAFFFARILKLKQMQMLGKRSDVYVRLEKLWNILGFSHTTRLEHGIAIYLLLPGTLYFVITLLLDYYVFVGKIQIVDFHFALMHVFYIFLPRYFAELFDFPVHFVRKRHQEKHKVPWSILPDWLKENGALPNDVTEKIPPWQPAEITSDTTEFISARRQLDSHFYKDFLNKLGVNDLYRHQYKAWEIINVRHKSLVLAAPFNSGRTTLALLSALHEASAKGNSVLFINPNPDMLKAIYHQFFSMLRQTVYFRHLAVFNMAEEDFLSHHWDEHLPQIIFTDIPSLERHMYSGWPARDLFFKNLTLVIAEDMDQTAGILATKLYFFLKQFTYLASWHSKQQLHYLVTVSPVYRNYNAFEKLLGSSFSFLEVDAYLFPNKMEIFSYPENAKEEAPTSFAGLTGKLAAAGYNPVIFSENSSDYQLWQGLKNDELPGRLKPFFSPFSARRQVAVLNIAINNIFRLFQQSKGIGDVTLSPSGRLFTIYNDDIFLEFLLERYLKEYENEKGEFVFSATNLKIAVPAIRSLLMIRSMQWIDLCSLFGERLVTSVFRILRNQDTLLMDTDNKYYMVASEDSDPASNGQKRIVLIHEDEEQTLFTISACQARSYLYPGKIFTYAGKHLKVPINIYDGLDRRETIELQISNDYMRTTKKAAYELRLLPSQTDRLIECRQGRLPFYYFGTRLDVNEMIYGYRQWLNGQFQSEFNYSRVIGQAVQNVFETPGIILFFHEDLFTRQPQVEMDEEDNSFGDEKTTDDSKADEETTVDPEVFSTEEKLKILLALAYLLKQTIQAYLFVPDDLIEVVVPEEVQGVNIFRSEDGHNEINSQDIIAIYDLFPGGSGYTDALSPEKLFHYLRIIRDFLLEKSPDLNKLLLLKTSRDLLPIFEDTDRDNLLIFLNNLLTLGEMPALRQVEKEVFSRLNPDAFSEHLVKKENRILEALPTRIKEDYRVFKSIEEEINKQWPV